MNTANPLQINFVMAGLSRKSSTGVFEVSRQLALHLVTEGNKVKVFGLADAHTAADNPSWLPIRPAGFLAAQPRRLGYSKTYLNQLLAAPADVAHLHVLWMYQSAMVYKWHKKFNKPYITTINGMLDPWAVKHAQLKKKLALFLYEHRALRACSCFQVNTQQECDYVRAFGLKNPVAIIKNGIAIPDLTKPYGTPPWSGRVSPHQKILLYLSRVHPKKGLPHLIDAMALLKQKGCAELNNWTLVIVGCTEGGTHEQELARQVARNKLEDKVLFLGQYYNEEMQSCYFHANAYILPSHSDGMPLAALNAWAFGKYSLLTPACNLSEGYGAGVAYRIETNPDSIAEGLQYLFTRSDGALKQLGRQAYEFVQQQYSWRKMAREIAAVYQWVTGRASMPAFVQVV